VQIKKELYEQQSKPLFIQSTRLNKKQFQISLHSYKVQRQLKAVIFFFLVVLALFLCK